MSTLSVSFHDSDTPSVLTERAFATLRVAPTSFVNLLCGSGFKTLEDCSSILVRAMENDLTQRPQIHSENCASIQECGQLFQKGGTLSESGTGPILIAHNDALCVPTWMVARDGWRAFLEGNVDIKITEPYK